MQRPTRRFNLSNRFGPPPSDQELWKAFVFELDPALTLAVISDRPRLREIHLHGWTIAVPQAQLKFYGKHRDRLEAALQRVHNGSPKCVHLVELGK